MCWSCKNGSAVKSTEFFSIGPEFKTQKTHGGSQQSKMGPDATLWCVWRQWQYKHIHEIEYMCLTTSFNNLTVVQTYPFYIKYVRNSPVLKAALTHENQNFQTFFNCPQNYHFRTKVSSGPQWMKISGDIWHEKQDFRFQQYLNMATNMALLLSPCNSIDEFTMGLQMYPTRTGIIYISSINSNSIKSRTLGFL